MNIFKLVSAGVNALKKGEILAHPEKWKTAQVLSMALVSVVVPIYSAICTTPDACYGVTSDEITQIATWTGGAAFAIFQIWTTIATTTKIGVGKVASPTVDTPVPTHRMCESERQIEAGQVQSNTRRSRTSVNSSNTEDQAESSSYNQFMGGD